jgi:hypothetical protein
VWDIARAGGRGLRSFRERGVRHCCSLPANKEAQVLKEARRQLEIAREALEALRVATDGTPNLENARRAWEQFIHSTNRAWNKAIAELNATGQSEAHWLEELRIQRNADELLIYVRQARHTDEHQHSLVLEVLEKPVIKRTFPTEGLSEREEFESGVGFQPLIIGQSATISWAGSCIKPVDLVDQRSGKKYPVPSVHRGRPLQNAEHRIAFIAELALSWYEGFVTTAASKVSTPDS